MDPYTNFHNTKFHQAECRQMREEIRQAKRAAREEATAAGESPLVTQWFTALKSSTGRLAIAVHLRPAKSASSHL